MQNGRKQMREGVRSSRWPRGRQAMPCTCLPRVGEGCLRICCSAQVLGAPFAERQGVPDDTFTGQVSGQARKPQQRAGSDGSCGLHVGAVPGRAHRFLRACFALEPGDNLCNGLHLHGWTADGSYQRKTADYRPPTAPALPSPSPASHNLNTSTQIPLQPYLAMPRQIQARSDGVQVICFVADVVNVGLRDGLPPVGAGVTRTS